MGVGLIKGFHTHGVQAEQRRGARSAVGVSLDLIIGWPCRYVVGQVQSCWKIHHSATFIIAEAKVLLRQASSCTIPLALNSRGISAEASRFHPGPRSPG